MNGEDDDYILCVLLYNFLFDVVFGVMLWFDVLFICDRFMVLKYMGYFNINNL